MSLSWHQKQGAVDKSSYCEFKSGNENVTYQKWIRFLSKSFNWQLCLLDAQFSYQTGEGKRWNEFAEWHVAWFA